MYTGIWPKNLSPSPGALCLRTSMAVLLETSKGDMVIDLYVEDCPRACLNFLKLCK